MCAYMMVLPVNLKPRRFRSALSSSDSLDEAGSCDNSAQRFTFWRPPTKPQM